MSSGKDEAHIRLQRAGRNDDTNVPGLWPPGTLWQHECISDLFRVNLREKIWFSIPTNLVGLAKTIFTNSRSGGNITQWTAVVCLKSNEVTNFHFGEFPNPEIKLTTAEDYKSIPDFGVF